MLFYSLKTDSWRHMETESFFCFDEVNNNGHCFVGTLVNGSLHWPLGDWNINENESRIHQFRLGDEKLSLVETPCVLSKRFNLMVFDRNKLHIYENMQGSAIQIWVLEEAEETETKWTKLMSIPITRNRINHVESVVPLSFWRIGEVKLCRNRGLEIQSCCLYNPSKGGVERLEVFRHRRLALWKTYK